MADRLFILSSGANGQSVKVIHQSLVMPVRELHFPLVSGAIDNKFFFYFDHIFLLVK